MILIPQIKFDREGWRGFLRGCESNRIREGLSSEVASEACKPHVLKSPRRLPFKHWK